MTTEQPRPRMKRLSRVSRGQKVITTNRGKPRAALVPRPSFFREIEAARREYAAKGGVPLEEARRRIRRQ